MPKRKQLSFLEKLRKIKRAGLSHRSPPNKDVMHADNIAPLNERVETILELFNRHKKKSNNMLFFVMYDIENDKIRTQIAKYLLRKGCMRIQKSIFLSEANREQYNEIHSTIREVQEVYDNNDSILIVPVSVDQLQSMKIIGQQLELDLIMGNKNTLFF